MTRNAIESDAIRQRLLPTLVLVAASMSAQASLPLHDMSLRVRVGGDRVIGVEQPERFESTDIGVTWRLPWERYGFFSSDATGWGVGTRLLGSLGWMTGASDSALVLSAIPLLAFGSADGRFTADMGIGGALLSRHQFEQQNYGGHFQFALTVGLSAPLYRNIGVGGSLWR